MSTTETKCQHKPINWFKKLFNKCVLYKDYIAEIKGYQSTVNRIKNAHDALKQSFNVALKDADAIVDAKLIIIADQVEVISRLTSESITVNAELKSAREAIAAKDLEIESLKEDMDLATATEPSVEEQVVKPSYRTTPLKKKEVHDIFKLSYKNNIGSMEIAIKYNLSHEKIISILEGKIYGRYNFLKKYTGSM